MKPNKTALLGIRPYNHPEIDARIAYHQAGHAVAICLGNKQKQLPSVYFQIATKQHKRGAQPGGHPARLQDNLTALHEGGRLIQNFPISFVDASQFFDEQQQVEYQKAFAADIFNLLAGPLAEAKYVAVRDGEIFTPNLINLQALRFYGGNPDLGLIAQYMDCYLLNRDAYEQKLNAIYLDMFSFLDDYSNWNAIVKFAEFILAQPPCVIDYDDAVAIINTGKMQHEHKTLPQIFAVA